ncbi:MAG: sulfite exporter TauE/SafE family protein, partial [Porticoccaceae bacterium]|nr:sulfite exporter TauE/SafE family protein [Porticoccaceae bacterium]
VCFSLLAFYIAAGMLQKARDTKLQVAAQGDDSGPENPPSECAPATAKKSGSATILAICGAVTGVLAGIFGVGGGFLVVPILTLVVGMDVRRAIATSLLVIAVVSTSGFISHLWLESLQSVAGLVPLALGAAGGMAIGTALVKRIPAHRLQEIFAACVVGLVSVTLVREFLA